MYDWLDREIREYNGYKSFQRADKIEDAIRLISDCKLWEEVGTILQKDLKDIKNDLNRIVDRRDTIAHEADIDPTYNIFNRFGIDEQLATESTHFIEQIADSVMQVIQKYK